MIEDTTFDWPETQALVRDHILDSNFDVIIQAAEEFFKTLDSYQREAVFQPVNGPFQVISAAGSGKTRVLISRALKLVLYDKVLPQQIVLITFTNKAAREIRKRYLDFFQPLLNDEQFQIIKYPHISTIHSFCYSVIRKVLFLSHKTILNEYHAYKLMRQAVLDVLKSTRDNRNIVNEILAVQEEISCKVQMHYFVIPVFDRQGNLISDKLSFKDNQDLSIKISTFLDNYSYSKINSLINSQGMTKRLIADKSKFRMDYASKVTGINLNEFEQILQRFYYLKYSSNCLDFSDCTTFLLYYIAQFPDCLEDIHRTYKHFICDEAQDTSLDQHSLLFLFDEETHSLYKERLNQDLSLD